MTSRTTVAATLVALSCGWSTAAFAQNRTDLQLMADMRMLHEELQQTRLLINTLAEQVKATNARLDALDRNLVKGFADQKLDIDEMTTAAARLSDKVSENSVRVGQFSSELTSIREGVGLSNTMLNQILSLLLPPAVVDPNAVDPVNPAAATPPNLPPLTGRPGEVAPGATPASAALAFGNANALYYGAKYELAAERLRQVVDQFPTDPRAPQALVFLGQSRYQLKDFKAAIAAFAEVVTKYPDSDQVPVAMYYQGLNHEQLKQTPDARRIYTALIKQFPNSTATLQAEQRLARIGGGDSLD